MVLAIITAWLAYQRAKASGRNAWLWAFIGIGVFIGTQLLVGMLFGLVLVGGMLALGWPESVFDDYELPINIVAVVGAIGASWLLIKYLDRVPEVEAVTLPPPPPPTFLPEPPPRPDDPS